MVDQEDHILCVEAQSAHQICLGDRAVIAHGREHGAMCQLQPFLSDRPGDQAPATRRHPADEPELHRNRTLRRHVFAEIPLAEAARAHGIIESRRNLNKVVLVP